MSDHKPIGIMNQFPIMGRRVTERYGTVPWDMMLEHRQQAWINHGRQSISTIAKRGGLSPCEAVAVLENRKWKSMGYDAAVVRLEALVAEWKQKQEYGY